MVFTLFEKLDFREEKNILVQGLPIAIERNFVKLKFAKNVTPLLKKKKINFALVFSINKSQLLRVGNEVFPAMAEDGALWIAFPKKTSKIISDLSKEVGWDLLYKNKFEPLRLINIDHTWNAVLFKQLKLNETLSEFVTDLNAKYQHELWDVHNNQILVPEDLQEVLDNFPKANFFFQSLHFSKQLLYIKYLEKSTTIEDRINIIEKILTDLLDGKFAPQD